MAGEDVFEKVWKRVAMLIRKKVSNPIAKAWISQELAKKSSSGLPTTTPFYKRVVKSKTYPSLSNLDTSK